MAALTVAQDEKGHLSPQVMDFVAGYLGIPPIAVYEVASFYAMYDLKPVGKHKLCICTNLPCALSGAEDAAEHLKRKLGIDWNETTADGRFTLKEGECRSEERRVGKECGRWRWAERRPDAAVTEP